MFAMRSARKVLISRCVSEAEAELKNAQAEYVHQRRVDSHWRGSGEKCVLIGALAFRIDLLPVHSHVKQRQGRGHGGDVIEKADLGAEERDYCRTDRCRGDVRTLQGEVSRISRSTRRTPVTCAVQQQNYVWSKLTFISARRRWGLPTYTIRKASQTAHKVQET